MSVARRSPIGLLPKRELNVRVSVIDVHASPGPTSRKRSLRFEPVFREPVGKTTALSATAMVRLKERWADKYDAWTNRPLGAH
jgi:hypothetical protein